MLTKNGFQQEATGLSFPGFFEALLSLWAGCFCCMDVVLESIPEWFIDLFGFEYMWGIKEIRVFYSASVAL